MTNAELAKRRAAAVPRGIVSATSIFAARAEGAEVIDVEGKRYIDFAGGIGALNTGHRHPTILEAVGRQLECYTHTAFQVMAYEPYVELCERLARLAPGPSRKKTLLVTTGAEAIENAVKIARAKTGRPAIVAFSGSFHGRTLLTTAMTGKTIPYKVGFGPFPGDVFHVPFPVENHGVSVDDTLRALDRVFRSDAEPEKVAAIVVEPVLGEGGFFIAPKELLEKLRRICDEHGICFVADEIQTGFGRTGKWFAIEHAGIEPDMIAVAKSLAGGFPLAGVIGKAEVMDAPAPGGLGGTYGGNPVACAAALAVLEVIDEEGLLARSDEIGRQIVMRAAEWKRRDDLPPIGDIRNLGGMAAFELIRERRGNEPDPVRAKAVTAASLEGGLVILSCGIYGNVIRFLVPLTATDAIVREGLDILERALESVAGAPDSITGAHHSNQRGPSVPSISRA